jgi:hypothetical protein
VRSRTSVIASGHRLIQSRASEIGSGLISRNRLLSLCSLVGSVSLPPSTLSTPRYHPLPCSYVVIVATRSLPLSPSLLACHYPPRTACSLSCRCCCCCCVVAITSTHQVSTTFSLSLSLSHSHSLNNPSNARSCRCRYHNHHHYLDYHDCFGFLAAYYYHTHHPPSLPIVFPSAVVASSIDHSIVHCSRLRATVWFRVLVYCVVIVIVVFVVDLLSAYCIDYLLVLFDQFSRCLASSSSSTHSRLVDHGPTPWC